MSNKFLRWPVLAIMAALVIAALIPAITFLHAGKPATARAASSTPTITIPSIVHPFDTVMITGQGFAPNDSIYVNGTDSNNQTILGASITCDVNGNCSGQIVIPYRSVPQGTYQLTARDSTGLTAQTSFTINPGIALTVPYFTYPQLTSGGPGTALQVVGGGFVPGEVLNINWGVNNPVLLGTVTVTSYDATFSLETHVPAPVTPGNYLITAVRTNQTPADASTAFQVLPVKMISSAGVLASQPAHIRLSGFQASEQVVLSWNANNNQTITTLTVDGTGALDTYVALPSAPKGAYTLQALGSTSQLHAQSSLNIGPGILLSLNTENPGGTTTVNGGGFVVGETIDVYFQSTANGITSVMADASGSFSVPLAIPVAHKQGTLYFVHAVSTTTKDNAKAQFFYATPSLQLAGNFIPRYGNSFTVAGAGFIANETVTLSAQNTNQKVPVKLGTATAASDGTFTFTSTMPGAPYPPSYGQFRYNMYIIARGATPLDKAVVGMDVQPAIFATPSSAQPGQKVKVNGGGFGAGETVKISEQSTQVGTATANNNGSFTITVVVPLSAYQGWSFSCNLCATGSTTSAQADFFLKILPAVVISPVKGPSSTPITVNGYAVNFGDTISIYWFDPGTSTKTLLTSVTVNYCCTFQTIVTAPSNLTSGTTYDVLAQDASGMNIQLPFQAT